MIDVFWHLFIFTKLNTLRKKIVYYITNTNHKYYNWQ